jgi:diguanylate cyclase (GGDEF)-like protein
VAVLCVAAGTAGSVLGARAVARTDAAKARQTFPRATAEIGSTLGLAIQHEEDLLTSASTFFAGNPKASAAEFGTWVKWARVLRNYPEIRKLGLVALVRAPELAAFQARITGHPVKPLEPVSASSTAGAVSTSPPAAVPGGSLSAAVSAPPIAGEPRLARAGTPAYSCLAAVELARSPVERPSTANYCALTPGLLASRDSALSVYTPVSITGRPGSASNRALGITTPVYRGNLPPSTFASRRGAFVGWLREVLLPGVMLRQVLEAHPGYALHLRYKAGSANIAFAGGSPRPDAQSKTVALHNGWTVRAFGPAPAGAGVLTDGDALALLIGGMLLSALLGLLIFLLGAPREPALAESGSDAPPVEDLYDALTGLPNRTLTLDRAERMVARAGRDSGMLAGALFVDVDRLKDVTEKLGQAASDQLLRIVGERLEGVVRAGDTVGRLGGDEFVVLVESVARGVRLDSLAQRMIEALHKPVELDDFGPSFVLTASIGVAFGRYATVEDLLRDAHLALTSAKAAGKDRYTLFNANMRTIIEGRAVLEVELNTALQEKQFFLLYQPIYDLSTQRVVGLEALIRWRHPAQGVLAPGAFIPLAEEIGLTVPIGRWALEEACTRAAAWNVAGHHVGVSVKVSAQQLNRDGCVTDVRRALQQSGIEPSRLTLQIGEAIVMRDVAAGAERLRQIKQLGVRIAIDDFGSGGYAHHADLRQMPLDSLRVDRSSLAASEDESYRSWLLEAILVVGRDLALTVIATGIETHEQLTSLQAMGCTLAQGALLGKPAPTEAVEGLFAAPLPIARATNTSPA